MSQPVACVTGGGSGLGRAIALELAALGSTVVIADVDEPGARAVADAIVDQGGEAWAIRCDVSDEPSTQQLFEAVRDEHGRLDALIANAGIFPLESGLDTPLEIFDRIIATNFRGAFLTAQNGVPLLLESKGSLVFIGSSSAKYSMVDNPAPGAEKVAIYAASKAAEERWALQLSKDLEPSGVHVKIFQPGRGVLTDAYRLLNPDESLHAAVPSPAEVAPLVVWLCSREAREVPDRLVSGLDYGTTWGPRGSGVDRPDPVG